MELLVGFYVSTLLFLIWYFNPHRLDGYVKVHGIYVNVDLKPDEWTTEEWMCAMRDFSIIPVKNPEPKVTNYILDNYFDLW